MHPLIAMELRRVAFAGDWHGSALFAGHALQTAVSQGADVVVQVGDFGLQDDESGRAFADAVEDWCQRLRVSILWVDGNHDDHDLLEQVPRVQGLGRIRDSIWHIPRGMRWSWGGLRWGGLGGAVSVDRRARVETGDWWHQEALTTADLSNWLAGGPVDVAVTHDAPAGANLPVTPGAWWGSEAMAAAQANREMLADALVPTRPAVVVHGHFHVGYDSTWTYPGGRAHIVGLGADDEAADNLWVVDLSDLRRMTVRNRTGC